MAGKQENPKPLDECSEQELIELYEQEKAALARVRALLAEETARLNQTLVATGQLPDGAEILEEYYQHFPDPH